MSHKKVGGDFHFCDTALCITVEVKLPDTWRLREGGDCGLEIVPICVTSFKDNPLRIVVHS